MSILFGLFGLLLQALLHLFNMRSDLVELPRPVDHVQEWSQIVSVVVGVIRFQMAIN